MFPLYKKELRYYLDNPIGYIVVVLIAVFSNFLFVKDIFVVGSASMKPFFSLIPWILLIFIPALTMRTLSEENRTNTLEVLLTLPVSEMQIMLAKFFALCTMTAIALFLTMGLPISLFALSKLYLPEIIVGYIGSLLLASSFIGVAMFFSSQTKNQVVAFLGSVVTLFVLLVLGTDFMASVLPKIVLDFLMYFTPQYHLAAFVKGVLDIRSFVYFASLMAVSLFLVTVSLEKRTWLKQLKISAASVLIIGAFILINILISPVSFLKYDLSFGNAYTLSTSTRKILKKLNTSMTISFFASSDLPARLLPLKNEVIDLLNEYQKENKGKLTVKILDPKKDQNALRQVGELGIPQLQFSQLEQDKYAVTASYFGIAINYGNQKEILPQVTDIESLEYNLTASIYRLIHKELVKIAVLGKTESFDPASDDLATFKSVLRQQFELDFIDVSSLKEIDPAYKTILVFDDNRKEYTEEEIQAIKTYIDNGGKALLFVDGVWISDNLATDTAKHNLFSLLSDYGITVNTDLVLSANAELVNFGNSQISFLSPYPFWLKTNIFNAKSSYFSNVRQLTFPWVSSVAGGNELIKTTNKSWEQKVSTASALVLDPQSIPQPQANELRQFTIVTEKKEKNGGVMMVIPSSRFILEKFLTRTSDNLGLVLNIVNDFASGGALSGIRQRAVSFYPLPDLPDNMKDLFKYGNILVLPLLFSFYGLVRLMKRR